jgi:signal transduction histidine kinase/PAS domain-containing protein
LIVALFLAGAATAAVLSVRHYQIHLRQTLSENRTSAELIALVIDEHQKAVVTLLQSYASRPLLVRAVQNRDPGQLRRHLIQLQQENREISTLVVTDREGTLWFNQPLQRETHGRNFAHRGWYRGVSRHWQPHISEVFRQVVGEQALAVVVAVPIFDAEGRPIHILAATQSLTLLAGLMERFPRRSAERVALIDQTGQMLFSSAHPYRDALTPYPFLEGIAPALQAGGKQPFLTVRENGGQRHITLAPIAHTGWTVAISVSGREILQGEIPFLLQIAGICLLLFLAVAAVLFAIRKDVRLRRIAAQLAAEQRVCEAAEALAQREAFIRTVLDHLPVGIAVNAVDPSVAFEYMNDLFPQIYRTTREALRDPDAFWEAVYEDPALREALKKRVLEDCAGSDPARMVWQEVPLTRRGGKTTFVTARNIPLPDKKRMVSLVWDVTEQKRAADEMQRRNAYLEALNETALGLLSRRDLEDLFQAIVVQARKFCRTDEAWISLLDPRSGEMTFTAADGKSRYLRGSHFPCGRGITGEIWRTGGTILIENYQRWPHRAQIAEYEVRRATVAVPLRHGGQIAGVLGLAHHEEGRRFDPEEVAMLERFAELASIALDNARLYERMTRELAERVKAEAEVQRLNEDLERRVSERTTQLEAVNRELTAFSYSVSHDLRAPLRGIDGFGLALLEDYGDRLDDTGKDYIRRIRRATQQMGRLIDDMLKLSRLTKAEMRRETVDLSPIVREVFAALRQDDPGRAVETVIQEGVCVQGDRDMLRVLLFNLLDNAWKFTGKNPRARIEFGVAEEEGQRVCFVRDNGVGFDMAYAGKLFGAFQRLHTQEAFPGTGIGLATVQRIVHRHGGWVRAEAEPGRGATFYFTL